MMFITKILAALLVVHATKVEAKKVSITDEELTNLYRNLFDNDTNNAFEHIEVIRNMTYSLYTVKPEAYQIPTIQMFSSLYKKYYMNTDVNKTNAKEFLSDQNLLIQRFLKTTVLKIAMRFLSEKGILKNDLNQYENCLRSLWFEPNNAFNTVFVRNFQPSIYAPNNSTDSTPINWIVMDEERKAQRMWSFLPSEEKILGSDTGKKAEILSFGAGKEEEGKLILKVMKIILGTSPELEIALYTICAYVKPEGHCDFFRGVKATPIRKNNL